jgi:shikimate kinase
MREGFAMAIADGRLPPMPPDQNVVLIGMPGAGKSTVGVLLAKMLTCDFVDTDVLIQAGEGQSLQDLIDKQGRDAFRAVEERYVCGLEVRRTVVATGGSVVYSHTAMRHLANGGRVVWLDLALGPLQRRLTNLATRGVVFHPGQSLADLYNERRPLYERYAEIRINCNHRTHEDVAGAVWTALGHGGPSEGSGRGKRA